MRARIGIAAGAVVIALVAHPLRSLAATANDCPGTIVPESPAGPVLLVVAALGALGFLAYWRRRGGLSATVVSTLTIAVLAGALLSTVVASAATSSCSGGGTDPAGQNVSGISQTTPFTGADIPWLTAAVLIVSGTVVSAVTRSRRRRSKD
ncbi:MAG: hypothetical protein JF886_13515 [Candidatus Dormibacteraeota bacterium]|uniref:Gram-positive cocci surface proteins LPxTG domain-containing protein n=1 Tax=Candidatus Aeolococcus gillhamiae TaxID=3127015 RepID=A0A2W5ZA01_9BACT|nr:hypothetical protein [Candidatus Dormibacteraeota bacterium]PZR82222.1 MAG: hypothetical protein DLM65_04425 [Candidatus Dormibacter sp. RRmetagenome_bin12]